MSIGPLAFLNPLLLAGLVALPLIWWLLRAVPPRPHRVAFPPTRILVGLEAAEKTPAKTPWWLTLIRMLAAAFIILALAEPVLNPNRETALGGQGPVVLAVDNGWASGPRWSERTFLLERLIEEAESKNRPVIIAPTANAQKAPIFKIEAPSAARSTVAAIHPEPFAPDRAAAAAALETALRGANGAAVVWLTDGIDHDGQARAFADRLAALASGGSFSMIATGNGQEALGAAGAATSSNGLDATIIRSGGGARAGIVNAYSARGQRLGEATFAFDAGGRTARASFEMPLELRNQVTRVEIGGERSAGAVHLLDSRSQRHRVGLVSGASIEEEQPLLAPLYYIERAVAPFAEVAKTEDSNLETAIPTLIKRNVSVLVLADIGTLAGDVRERVEQWVNKGGVLVRFAGHRLEKGGDDLLPVALRLGGRTLGGALSWATPQPLAPFETDSLFAGLDVPSEVVVNRQVLADPARLDGKVKVWARLKDGTPLVTASRHGDGQLVLFHVTANSDWSNLPLSGLFVEMLRRVATLGRLDGGSGGGVETADATPRTQSADVLSPVQTLDGFGLLTTPPPVTQAIAASDIDNTKPSAEHPPGYYGAAGAPRALNLLSPKSELKPIADLPAGIEQRAYEGQSAQPLKPTFLGIALSLLLADVLIILILQAGGLTGLLRRPRPSAAGIVFGLLLAGLAAIAHSQTAEAQVPPPAGTRPAARALDPRALQATSKVTFGYVLTGDLTTDQTSRQGLSGLVKFLTARTAVEPGEPVPVDILNDEIAFYPILYWPVLANARPLPEPALAKIDAYMKQGGMIVFDTKDYGQGVPLRFSLQSEAGTPMQRLLGNLDVPRLEPVPENHVLTKSFYLLRNFPGRWDGGQLWVEAEAPADSRQGQQARRVDGVSSILVTSNDFAAAWALDDRNQPLYAVVPGGERQREMAFRTGVNIVMYALTGNYKADQVHVPAVLERLGQ